MLITLPLLEIRICVVQISPLFMRRLLLICSFIALRCVALNCVPHLHSCTRMHSRMASSGDAHSNNSQFYITLRALPFLDGKRVAFGQVVMGLEVLDLINNVRASPRNKRTGRRRRRKKKFLFLRFLQFRISPASFSHRLDHVCLGLCGSVG